MKMPLSDRALSLLEEENQFAVLSTINPDGSSQLTTMWYLLQDDGTLIMNTIASLQKVKNIRRDPRVAVCIEDGNRYVSINGTVNIITDQTTVQQTIKQLVERYIKDDEKRQQYISLFTGQDRVVLHLTGEKYHDFSV